MGKNLPFNNILKECVTSIAKHGKDGMGEERRKAGALSKPPEVRRMVKEFEAL
jgi:hypothetical protein